MSRVIEHFPQASHSAKALPLVVSMEATDTHEQTREASLKALRATFHFIDKTIGATR